MEDCVPSSLIMFAVFSGLCAAAPDLALCAEWGPPDVDPVKEKRRLAQIDRIVRAKEVDENCRAILQWMRTDPSERVQYTCADAFKQFVSPQVRDELLRMLRDKKVQWTRRAAVWGALRSQAEVVRDEHVAGLLKADNDSDLCEAIKLAGLVDISQDTRDRILRHLERGRRNVKVKVVTFIGIELGTDCRFKTAKQVPEEVRERNIKLLKRTMGRETNRPLRKWAATVLAETGNHDALPVMMEILAEEYPELKLQGKTMTYLETGVVTIRRLTGKSFGFREARDEESKDKAIRQWLDWWEKNKENPKFRLPPATR